MGCRCPVRCDGTTGLKWWMEVWTVTEYEYMVFIGLAVVIGVVYAIALAKGFLKYLKRRIDSEVDRDAGT